MDQEPLSLFPSERECLSEIDRLGAPMPSSCDSTDARLQAVISAIQTLEHEVQMLKARNELIAHKTAEDHRRPNVINTHKATTPEGQTAQVGLVARGERVVVLVVLAIILALVGARVLRPAGQAPPTQAKSIALAAPTLNIAEPAIIPPTRSSEVKIGAVPLVNSRSADAKALSFRGDLVLDSVPRGATVLINQRPVGTTPVRLRRYPAGSHAVWIEREGYKRWTAGVLVPANKTTYIRTTLRPESESATSQR